MIKLFVLKLASLKILSTPRPRRAPYDPIGSLACFLGCTLVGGLVEAVRLVVCLLVFEWARPFLNNTGSVGNLCNVSFS